LLVNHGIVVLAAGLALVLGIVRPDLLASLQLLTFSGLARLAPRVVAVVGAPQAALDGAGNPESN
jgi:SSS family solute:Na+ symporter